MVQAKEKCPNFLSVLLKYAQYYTHVQYYTQYMYTGSTWQRVHKLVAGHWLL